MFHRVLQLWLMLTLIISMDAAAQFTVALNGSSYHFLNSADNNLHYGPQIRAGVDFQQFQLDLGFAYYMPVISKVNTFAYEVNPISPYFPNRISIVNSVDGVSFETTLQMNYFIYGQPIDGRGVYGFLGGGILIYSQKNNLSNFNRLEYYSEKFIDGAITTSSQFIFDFGFGTKFPFRNGSWFLEGKFSLPTNPYKEYGLAIETSPYISFNAGLRFHILTRKNKYQKIALSKKRFNKR
jgi:hypothetical protein